MEAGHLSERAKIRFLRRVGGDAPGMLLLSLADFLATAGPAVTGARRHTFGRLLDSLLGLYFQRDAASIREKNLVTGRDLIEELGITPGPVVGRLLRLLEEARVEGKVGNREEAIRLARSLLHRTTQGNRVPPREESDA
jgi:poly(A) polymerase